MQVSSTGFRKGTGDFMNWWFGELSAFVPNPLRLALKPVARTIAVTLDGDEISLTRMDGGLSETIGRFTLDDDKFGAARTEINRIVAEHPTKIWRWGVYLGGDAVLSDVLHLPSAAAENYAEAVEFQLDRQSPFQRGEIYFDCRPVAANTGGVFGVEYIIAPRSNVDSILRRLTAIGIPVDFVTSASDLSGVQLPYNLLPDLAPVHRQRSHRLNAVLAGLVVVLGGSALYLSLDYDRRHATALAAHVDQLRQEARIASGLRDALSAEDRNVNSVLDLKRDRASISKTLNDLSALLPDDTWVSRFTYKGGNAQIVVHAPESASIVGLIEGSDEFAGAKMMTAVRKLKNENRERFTLGFSTKMGGKP
jgi:general secretion pathway protein L